MFLLLIPLSKTFGGVSKRCSWPENEKTPHHFGAGPGAHVRYREYPRRGVVNVSLTMTTEGFLPGASGKERPRDGSRGQA